TFSSYSVSAQYVKRDYSGTPVEMAAGQTAPADIAYIQNTPGTYARIKIPGLAGLNNSIIHRAELIMEQVYDISDSLFTAPSGLFLDAYDPSVSKYRTIPYDFQIDYTSTPNFASLGVYNFWKKDLFGNTIR